MDSKFRDALELAYSLHLKQFRKSTEIPYISHLMAVSSLVLEASEYTDFKLIREDLAIAALLHDSLEDQGHKISLLEIEKRFGALVAEIVRDCSDDVITTEGQDKAPWKERKLAYLENLSKKRRETQLVSCADKLHNARSILGDKNKIGEKVWDRFNADKSQTLWYYRTLVETFQTSWPQNPLVDELKQTVELLA